MVFVTVFSMWGSIVFTDFSVNDWATLLSLFRYSFGTSVRHLGIRWSMVLDLLHSSLIWLDNLWSAGFDLGKPK